MVIHTRFLWLLAQNRQDELTQVSAAYLSARGSNLAQLLTAGAIMVSSDSVQLRKEGIRLLEHAVALFPTSARARLDLASSLYQTGDAERAEKAYRELLEQRPDDIRALNDLAWILQERHHRYDDALTLVEKGLRLAPDNVHLLDTRGTILSNLPNRETDAKRDFGRILETSSSDPRRQARAHLQLGRICAKLNDGALARKHMEDALKIDEGTRVFTASERSEISGIVQRAGGS
jgi:tetratricopeptide (TPR) repeat protein